MRDFPIFTTEYGASSLVLREIPYRGAAYILLGSAGGGEMALHLRECIDFCRAAGAQTVFADGWDGLTEYPLHSRILEMRGPVLEDPSQIAALFPVTEQTAGQWRQLYNRAMEGVDHARTLECRDEAALAKGTGAYFVHEGGELLGIGWMDGETLLAMAAARPGAGERVLRTLMSLVPSEMLRLEVASTNLPALKLYRRMGFCETAILRQWRVVSREYMDCQGKILDNA